MLPLQASKFDQLLSTLLYPQWWAPDPRQFWESKIDTDTNNFDDLLLLVIKYRADRPALSKNTLPDPSPGE